MESTPPFEVVVPRKARRHGLLSVEQALPFTPLTTSPLQASDQIPLPSLSQWNEHAFLSSSAEREAVSRLQYNHQLEADLQDLLRPSALAEM